MVVDVSDDEGDDTPAAWAKSPVYVSAASQALAVKWLRTARASLNKKKSGEDDGAIVRRRKPGDKGRKK